jgi:hypothetical protein
VGRTDSARSLDVCGQQGGGGGPAASGRRRGERESETRRRRSASPFRFVAWLPSCDQLKRACRQAAAGGRLSSAATAATVLGVRREIRGCCVADRATERRACRRRRRSDLTGQSGWARVLLPPLRPRRAEPANQANDSSDNNTATATTTTAPTSSTAEDDDDDDGLPLWQLLATRRRLPAESARVAWPRQLVDPSIYCHPSLETNRLLHAGWPPVSDWLHWSSALVFVVCRAGRTAGLTSTSATAAISSGAFRHGLGRLAASHVRSPRCTQAGTSHSRHAARRHEPTALQTFHSE